MGTRSNFYKNPSISYKKDFSLSSVLQNLRAYNIATGNAPPSKEQPLPEDETRGRRKRRREREVSRNKKCEIRVGDGPMSHQDYIEKRRKEVTAPQAYDKLTEDDLGTPSLGVNLVEYENSDDESTSSECEEKQDHPNSSHLNEFDKVKSRRMQRFPIPGEPVCLLCGKYGEYICNETDDDICSMECKLELLEILKSTEEPSSIQTRDVSSSGAKYTLPSTEFGEDSWDYNRHRWSKKKSILCTYECWKCQRPGHLAEDCLVMANNQVAVAQNKYRSISGDLLGLYRRCHQIGKNASSAKCNACHSSFSLATCLDCSTVFCDSAGHLNQHIRTHPSHGQYFSHKLKRLVKCCKSACKVTGIKDLLVCHYCFNKAFDKFYDMYTATWKRSGLSIIQGSICCDDHLEWHRMNCFNSDVEDSAYVVCRNAPKETCVQLSDFIF